MNATLRRAKPEDAPAIAEIERSWPATPHWSVPQVAEEIGRIESAFLVLEDEQGLVGYAAVRVNGSDADLMTIAVRPGSARKGFGRSLLEAAVAETKARGAERLCLEVELSNEAALRIYRAVGFVEVGRRRDYYGRGRTAVLMDFYPLP